MSSWKCPCKDIFFPISCKPIYCGYLGSFSQTSEVQLIKLQHLDLCLDSSFRCHFVLLGLVFSELEGQRNISVIINNISCSFLNVFKAIEIPPDLYVLARVKIVMYQDCFIWNFLSSRRVPNNIFSCEDEISTQRWGQWWCLLYVECLQSF